MFAQQIFGENLGAFKFRAALFRAEAGDVQHAVDLVDEARDKRRFRADDDQVRFFAVRKTHDAFHVGTAAGTGHRRAVLAARERDPGVSGQTKQLRHAVALRQFPTQRVFAPARSNHQYFHELQPRSVR